MINSYPISPDKTRVGVIVYGKDARIVVPFRKLADRNFLQYMPETLQTPNDGLRLDKAITLANTDLFTEQRGSRPSASKVLVVFWNQKLSTDPVEAAQRLMRERRTKIISVAIGSDISFHGRGFVSKKEMAFGVDSFGDYEKIRSDIIMSSLPGNVLIFCLFIRICLDCLPWSF